MLDRASKTSDWSVSIGSGAAGWTGAPRSDGLKIRRSLRLRNAMRFGATPAVPKGCDSKTASCLSLALPVAHWLSFTGAALTRAVAESDYRLGGTCGTESRLYTASRASCFCVEAALSSRRAAWPEKEITFGNRSSGRSRESKVESRKSKVGRSPAVILKGVPQWDSWWCGTKLKNPAQLPATSIAVSFAGRRSDGEMRLDIARRSRLAPPPYFIRSKFFFKICQSARPDTFPRCSAMIFASLAFLVGASLL